MEPISFGKYTLLRRLAVGGMAELYLARSSDAYGVDRLLVLKVIARRYARDETFAKMFQDEVRITATLNHPNIGQVVDVGVVGGRQFLAMEHLFGKDLRGIVRRLRHEGRRGVPLHVAVHIGTRVCAALQHAHEARTIDGEPLKIVHRDVSPSNIMVTYDGHVKLLDFGIARAANRVSLTRPGEIKGKVRYLSPEQLLGKTTDHRTDIFTLGVSLWEATVGRHLFEGKQEVEIYDAISKGSVRAPSSLIPDYDPELERIVLKALAFEPSDRYDSAREMQEDLESCASRGRLMLSDLATSEFLTVLFADELAMWREAQGAGRSLLDHLVATATEDEQDLGSMQTGQEDRRTIPDEAEAPTAVAGSIEASQPAPGAVRSGPSGGERKTMMFGDIQGPVFVPPGDVSPGVSASPGRPVTVSARPVTGPTPPIQGRPKKATGSQSLSSSMPSLRVSDGVAIEVKPQPGVVVGGGLEAEATVHGEEASSPLDRRGGVRTAGGSGGAPAGSGLSPGPGARAVAASGEAGEGRQAVPLEPATSSKMTVIDLGAPPIPGRSAVPLPASGDVEEPASRRLMMAGTGEVDLQALGPGRSGGGSSALAKKGSWPFSSPRSDLSTSFSSSPAKKASAAQGTPPAALATQAASSSPASATSPEAMDFASRATAPFLGRDPSGEGPLAPGHAASSAAVPAGGGAYSEPVVAEDRAALSAALGGTAASEGEDDEGGSKARRKRVQTGDWSHQGRDRRPGTHPFFKGDDGIVQAPNFDNPYVQASKAEAWRRWRLIVILSAAVALIGGAAVAAWWWFHVTGSQGATIKITSRPSGATVFNGADGRALGKTPLRLDGERFRRHEVEVHLAGYQVATLVLSGEAHQHVVLRRRAPKAGSGVQPGKAASAPTTPASGSPSTPRRSAPAAAPKAAQKDEIPQVHRSAKSARTPSPRPSPSAKSLSKPTPKPKKKRWRKPRKKPKKEPNGEEGLKDPFG